MNYLKKLFEELKGLPVQEMVLGLIVIMGGMWLAGYGTQWLLSHLGVDDFIAFLGSIVAQGVWWIKSTRWLRKAEDIERDRSKQEN